MWQLLKRFSILDTNPCQVWTRVRLNPLAHQMSTLLHPFTKLIWGSIAMYLWKLCIPKVKEIHVWFMPKFKWDFTPAWKRMTVVCLKRRKQLWCECPFSFCTSSSTPVLVWNFRCHFYIYTPITNQEDLFPTQWLISMMN